MAAPPDAMSKGDQTRQAILRTAVDLSSEVGLEALSIGLLAKGAGMSKSGLYAHFDSKEDLQCQVLNAAAQRFVDVVVSPAIKKARGLPRIEAMFRRWLKWGTEELQGGCVFMAAASEYDDRPGKVRDTLVGHQQALLGTITRAALIAVEEGHFDTELDTEQFAFEFWGLLLAHQHYERLLGRPDATRRVKAGMAALIERSSS